MQQLTSLQMCIMRTEVDNNEINVKNGVFLFFFVTEDAAKKLECLFLASYFRLVLYSGVRIEPTQVNHLIMPHSFQKY